MDILEERKKILQKKEKRNKKKREKLNRKLEIKEMKAKPKLKKIILNAIKKGKTKVVVEKYIHDIGSKNDFFKELENEFGCEVRFSLCEPYLRFEKWEVIIFVKGE